VLPSGNCKAGREKGREGKREDIKKGITTMK
jgi:hypothetical protein